MNLLASYETPNLNFYGVLSQKFLLAKLGLFQILILTVLLPPKRNKKSYKNKIILPIFLIMWGIF